MKIKKYSYKWLRHPRTTQEARFNCDVDHKEYVRARRRFANLPNAYDDDFIDVSKSWKNKREKQYRVGKRGPRKEMIVYLEDIPFEVSRWSYLQNFRERCEKSDISYTIEYIWEPYTGTHYITQERKYVEYIEIVPHYENGILISTECVTKKKSYWVTLDKPIKRVYNGKRLRGYKLIWWERN